MLCSWFEVKSKAFIIFEYCNVWILYVYYWDYLLDSSFHMNIGSFKQFCFLLDKTGFTLNMQAGKQMFKDQQWNDF